MDKKSILRLVQRESEMIWDSLCEIYPTLVFIDPPRVKLNPYFWRTAGCCHQANNVIELGYKFFQKPQNVHTMIDIILPHEIIHQVDYNIYGDSEKICGHGANWQKIMLEYGLPADPFHSMEIPRK